ERRVPFTDGVKTAFDLGAHGHLHQPVVEVAAQACAAAQLHVLAGVDIAGHFAIEDHVLGMNLAFDQATGADPHQTFLGDQVALQAAVQLYGPLHPQVAYQHGTGGNDAGLAVVTLQIGGCRLVLATPHGHLTSSLHSSCRYVPAADADP